MSNKSYHLRSRIAGDRRHGYRAYLAIGAVGTALIVLMADRARMVPARDAGIGPAPSAAALAITRRVRPLAFEANHGQFSPAVKYAARGQGFNLFVTDHEMAIAIPEAAKRDAKAQTAAGATSVATK